LGPVSGNGHLQEFEELIAAEERRREEERRGEKNRKINEGKKEGSMTISSN